MKKVKLLSRILVLSVSVILFASCLSGCGNNQQTNALEDMALVDIITQIYEIKPVELNLYTDPMDHTDQDSMSFNAGLTNFDKVTEAAISEPMMSSQAYSLVMVRVGSETEAASVANEMKSGINTAKWICVQADDLQVVSYRDVIMLIMVSSDLSETVTSQEIVDAFKQICGEDVTVY